MYGFLYLIHSPLTVWEAGRRLSNGFQLSDLFFNGFFLFFSLINCTRVSPTQDAGELFGEMRAILSPGTRRA